MNVKYGIMTKQMLITLEKRLINFPWENIKKSQHKRYISLFNKTVKNIISKYVPHKTVTFDDRDPPWINNSVKKLILERNEMYKKYVKENEDPRLFDKRTEFSD